MNELNLATVLAVVLFLLRLLLPAYLPSLAKVLFRGWVWLYTSVLPHEVKERHRMEMASEFWEQMQAERAEGFAPHDAALRVLGHFVHSIPSHLSWSISNIRLSSLPLRLPWRPAVHPTGTVKHSTGTAMISARACGTVISGHGARVAQRSASPRADHSTVTS